VTERDPISRPALRRIAEDVLTVEVCVRVPEWCRMVNLSLPIEHGILLIFLSLHRFD
jgi:hypothetical protein